MKATEEAKGGPTVRVRRIMSVSRQACRSASGETNKVGDGRQPQAAKGLGLTVPPDILALVDKGHRIGGLRRCTWQEAALRDEADSLRRINFT
jgi:hypothetical protein